MLSAPERSASSDEYIGPPEHKSRMGAMAEADVLIGGSPPFKTRKVFSQMINCAACNAPLVEMTVHNTDIRTVITCSCSNINEVHGFRGKLTTRLATTYRHPDYVIGSDEERHRQLRAGLLELESTLTSLTELRVPIKKEKDRLWKTVQNSLVTRHQAADAIETLGRKAVAEKLASMFTPEQLEEMMKSL